MRNDALHRIRWISSAATESAGALVATHELPSERGLSPREIAGAVHTPERAGGSRARRAGIYGADGDGYGKRRRPLSGAHTNAAHERATADVKTQVSCGRYSLLFSDAIVISN
jgi:hypothetical protein